MTKIITPNRAEIAQTGLIPEGYLLIQDTMPLKVVKKNNIVTEDRNGVSRNVLRLTGIFQRANTKNANGRVYPMPVLESAIKEIQEAVTSRRCMGEFDHPEDAKIHLDNVSHLITKIWMENKVCYGEIEVLADMPKGSMLKTLIDSNVEIGISSRGIGDMEISKIDEEECYEVQPGFTLVTWDIVAEPSVTGTRLTVLESLRMKRMNKLKLKESTKNKKRRMTGKQIIERNILKELHNNLF